MKKIIVLGAGLVGKPMALDLHNDSGLEITVADFSIDKLEDFKEIPGINTIQFDVTDQKRLKSLLEGFDLVVNAVPGFLGFSVLETILSCGKNVVDIAFSPEDLNTLNDLAVEKNATAIVDFGVAPGLSHLVVSHTAQLFDQLDKVRIFVGGLPKKRTSPFEYAAVFSPVDVIEEYTRPARLVKNGEEIIMEALTDVEELEFERVGTLEAFNSDGLRSLVRSIRVTDMAEKTLRYPGHAKLMRIFRDTGFFNQEKIQVGDTKVSPMDVTSKLLFPKWELKEGDLDLTVMKIIVKGMLNGKKQGFEFDLYDEFDIPTGVHSMARTTGYTATMGVRLLLQGKFTSKGVFYPEEVGKEKSNLDFILKGLTERGIQISQKMYEIS